MGGDDIISKTDWRIAQSVVFFILFYMIAASSSTPEQKPGLRIALAIGIVFLLNEVQWLNEVSKVFTDEGYKPDPKIERLSNLFPQNLCVFEKVQILYFIYFFIFNILC